MLKNVTLREVRPDDGEALRVLSALSPDGGRFAISPEFQINPYDVFFKLGSDTTGVLAEIPQTGAVVGFGLVDIQERYLNETLLPCATLHSLNVHPAYRRQGVATQLGRWRIEYAEKRIGAEGGILALIQRGNAGSLAAAQKWKAKPIGQYCNSLIRVREQPPTEEAGLMVRPAKASELEQIAQRLNNFYRGYNLHTPHTGSSLKLWLHSGPFPTPFRAYHVVVDSQNNILAGLAIAEQCRLVTMRVQHMPKPVTLLNKCVKMVPESGIIKQINASKLWFAGGQLAAARYLWESIRWQVRAFGTHLVCSYDPVSPLPDMIRPPRWLPKGSSFVMAHLPLVTDNVARPIYFS
jgi:GNAT superfamily N-acetyltransferase